MYSSPCDYDDLNVLKSCTYDDLNVSSPCTYDQLNVSGPCDYDDLNVSGPCDLSTHSITTAQKCQAPAHKFFGDLTLEKHKHSS